MLNWRNYSMEKSDRKIELTKQEKRSSLEAKFWNDKQKIDKNTSLMQKMEKIFNHCRNCNSSDNHSHR